MDGTVNEGILLHKGQEKRKTLWYQQMKGICPFTFRGQRIRETFIFSLERIFDKYVFSVFFYQTLIGHPYFCYFSCLSLIQVQCCDLVATGLRPWVNFALHKLTGRLFLTWQKRKKGKGKCTGHKRIKSNKQPRILGRKQWQASQSI